MTYRRKVGVFREEERYGMNGMFRKTNLSNEQE